jgi:hypothetical protein
LELGQEMQGITCVIDWPGTMSFIKDLVVAVAAIVTATVACFGISKWRAEESGKADFDLARRLGKAVYQFRDALTLARRWFVASSEFPEGKTPAADSGRPEADAYVHVFNQRLEGVKQSGLEVQALRNEAEALWGKEISEKLGTLLYQSVTLQVAMKTIVSDKQAFGANFRHNQAFGKKMEARAFDSGDTINDDGMDGPPNEFTVQIEGIVENVSAFLRTKLPRQSRRPKPTR